MWLRNLPAIIVKVANLMGLANMFCAIFSFHDQEMICEAVPFSFAHERKNIVFHSREWSCPENDSLIVCACVRVLTYSGMFWGPFFGIEPYDTICPNNLHRPWTGTKHHVSRLAPFEWDEFSFSKKVVKVSVPCLEDHPPFIKP